MLAPNFVRVGYGAGVACEDAVGEDLGVTSFEADHEVDFLVDNAKKQTVIDLEARRRHCVHRVLEARQACEELSTLLAGSGSGQAGPASASQGHAQGLLCAAIRELEETDALLEQARQGHDKEKNLASSGKAQATRVVSYSSSCASD